MPNPAALAMALLLGHEARITDEQWEDVRVMIQQRNYCIFKDCLALAIVGQSTCEEHQEIIFKPPTVTATPCPACEAAQNDVRLMQERLQRLIDAEPQQDVIDALNALCDKQAAILSRVAVALRGPEPPQTKWSHADLPERAAAVVRERDEARDILASMTKVAAALQAERDGLLDLRARVAALASELPDRHWPRTSDAGSASEQIAAELRDLLRKEAK